MSRGWFYDMPAEDRPNPDEHADLHGPSELELLRAWEAWTAHRQQLDRQANERAAVEREAS